MSVTEETLDRPRCKCHGEPMRYGRKGYFRCAVKAREATRRYNKTPKGVACRKRYRVSAKGKAATKRYNDSPKGRVRVDRYIKSERGRETRHRNEVARYEASDWRQRHLEQLRSRRIRALKRMEERRGKVS